MIQSSSGGPGVGNAGLSNTVAGILGIVIVLALSIPALLTFYRRFARAEYEPLDGIYEDEDGKATEESQKAFSTFLPRTVALVASILGGMIAVFLAVLETLDYGTIEIIDSWLRVGCWVC